MVLSVIVGAAFITLLIVLGGVYVWLGRHPGRRVRYGAVRDAHRDAMAFDRQAGANVDLSWTAARRDERKQP